ncbi:MAG TPA: cytochrome b562 [Opitutaceae bacterium]|nr:cytochrome b562 [Opitutaceae bacterium]
MKIRVLLFSVLCAFLAAQSTRAADRPHRDDEKQTELGKHMEKMGHAFRALGKEVADPARNEDSLKQVEIIRTNAAAGLNLKPEKTADLPEDQRAKFVADYQKHMKSFLADVDKLEAALKAGNNQDAEALVKTLKKDMGAGHKEFRKKHDM